MRVETSAYDVVVLGEGEETFVNLVRAQRQGEPLGKMPGLAFRNNGKIVNTGLANRIREVGQIPWPDWESFPIQEYIQRNQSNGINIGLSMPLLATRGCPYQCTFCSSPNMWTTRYIARSVDDVLDEMEFYHRRYGVINFDLQDLTAIIKRRWAIEFCEKLIERNLGFTWQMPSGTRTEVFDKTVADLLYRSGCRNLAFAPESGSPEILEYTQKRVDLEKMQEAMKIAVDSGLSMSCFFIIGFPVDTRKTMRQTLRLIRRVAMLGVQDVAVSKFVPYPGSKLFKLLLSEGKIELTDEYFISPMDFYTKQAPSYAEEISTGYLYRMMIWMFLNFYVISFLFHPLRTVKVLAKALWKGQEETRYAKWLLDRIRVRRRWRKQERSAG